MDEPARLFKAETMGRHIPGPIIGGDAYLRTITIVDVCLVSRLLAELRYQDVVKADERALERVFSLPKTRKCSASPSP